MQSLLGNQRPVDGVAAPGRLPPSLREGLERLSGVDLGSVRVHTGSSEPHRLDAVALTRGTEIHLSAGHESQLPHEGWHVVQQMQGRADPTTTMHGIPLNDDAHLEREADVMGARALRIGEAGRPASTPPQVHAPTQAVVQRAARPAAAPDPVELAVESVITRIDQLTLDAEENEILRILRALSPREFQVFLRRLAARKAELGKSYLTRLWEDMHGTEFQAYLMITTAKSIAARAGPIEDFPAALREMTTGSRAVERRLVYAAPTLTRLFASYPASVSFDAEGNLDVEWITKEDLWDQFKNLKALDRATETRFSLEPTDLVAVTDQETGRTRVLSAVEFKAFAEDSIEGGRWAQAAVVAETVRLHGAVSAVASAKGAISKAIIALMEVVIPTAATVIADREQEIRKLHHGPEFLKAWWIFNLAYTAYGIAQLIQPGGSEITANMLVRAADLEQGNTLSPIPVEVGNQVSEIVRELQRAREQLPPEWIELQRYHELPEHAKSELIETLQRGRVSQVPGGAAKKPLKWQITPSSRDAIELSSGERHEDIGTRRRSTGGAQPAKLDAGNFGHTYYEQLIPPDQRLIGYTAEYSLDHVRIDRINLEEGKFLEIKPNTEKGRKMGEEQRIKYAHDLDRERPLGGGRSWEGVVVYYDQQSVLALLHGNDPRVIEEIVRELGWR